MSHQVNVDPLIAYITTVKLYPIPAFHMHPLDNGEATTLTYIIYACVLLDQAYRLEPFVCVRV